MFVSLQYQIPDFNFDMLTWDIMTSKPEKDKMKYHSWLQPAKFVNPQPWWDKNELKVIFTSVQRQIRAVC